MVESHQLEHEREQNSMMEYQSHDRNNVRIVEA